MDPAFSLADELADLHHHSSYHHTNELLGEEDELQFHPHYGEYAAGITSLADEYDSHQQGGFGLDAELEGLHLHGNDLASELGGGGGGSLADELDPAYSGAAGSLGDELLQHIEKEDDDGAACMSRNPSASDAFFSGASSPTSSSRHATLSRQSAFLNPSSPPRSSISTTTTTTPIAGDATSSTATAISSTLASLAQTAELDETFSATQTFLSHLSSLSMRNPGAVDATTTTTTTTGESGEEDTARLEHAAANYLKLVSQSTAEREAQLRELRELDRRFARSLAENNTGGIFGLSSSSNSSSGHSYGAELSTFSPGASSSLALPEVEEDEEESDSFSAHLASCPTRSLARRHRSTASLASDTTITDVPPSSHPPTTPTIDSTLFAPFYTSTSSLLTSLSSLHEHTQITKSTTADAARKLKTLKGLIQQWRAEMDSVESSELWIQSHQGQDADRERQVCGVEIEKPKAGKIWLGKQVDWCQRRIEEVEVRARMLLTPVSLSS